MIIVRKNIGKVFAESDGAIVYKGEKAGLHTRVFITKQDIPTYEAKEVGLAFAKQKDYPNAHRFIVITANEIDDYFRVLVAAISEIDRNLADKIKHLSHGVVRAVEGKMSSRTGNIKLFETLELNIKEAIWNLYGPDKEATEIVQGAIKYEFLKHRLGQDFIFDVDESVSIEGNSGPYLQYSYARAISIIRKSSNKIGREYNTELNSSERSLVRKISEYPEIVERATKEMLPSHVATYLYELAQVFNRFYEKNRVIGDAKEIDRLTLVFAYINVLNKGLGLLNISAPERM